MSRLDEYLNSPLCLSLRLDQESTYVAVSFIDQGRKRVRKSGGPAVVEGHSRKQVLLNSLSNSEWEGHCALNRVLRGHCLDAKMLQ